MTSITIRTALIALLLPMAGATLAQTPPPPAVAGAPTGDSMTLAQYQVHQAERLMAADTDHDGRISLAEWTAQTNERRGGGGHGGFDPAQLFARMDTNHDGFLDKTEIDAASAERFGRMDTNGDGVVTADERMAMRGGGMHGHGGHHGHGGGQEDQPMPPPTTPQQ